MRRLVLVVEAESAALIENALYWAGETALTATRSGEDSSDDGARVSWRWENTDAPARVVLLTADNERDLAEVLGDARAYRVGDSDPNEPYEAGDLDGEGVARVKRLAERLEIAPS